MFVGETTDNGRTVGGQHNWVRLYLLEQQDSIQYKGYIDHEEFSPANSTVRFEDFPGWNQFFTEISHYIIILKRHVVDMSIRIKCF